MAMLGNGIGIALILRWLSVKIVKDFKGLPVSPYDQRIKWLASGTVFVLMFLWGIGLLTIAKPELAKAQFKAINFQPNPAREGEEVTLQVHVEAQEPITSVYVIDHATSKLYELMPMPSSTVQKGLTFIGKWRVERRGLQRLIVVLNTPTGRLIKEVFLEVQ